MSDPVVTGTADRKRYKVVGNLRSLTGQGTGWNIASCLECGALVWEQTQHDAWHRALTTEFAVRAQS